MTDKTHLLLLAVAGLALAALSATSLITNTIYLVTS